MSGTVKQFVDFSNNTANDTGENTATSIQRINNGETIDETVLRRPSESLRQRTEALKNASGDTLYLRDADRQLVLAGPGEITWPGSTTALQSGIPVISDVLYLLPMLTPGFAQTAPVPPVASAFGVIHLKRASDSMNSIAVSSLRRSYAAGDQINITVEAGAVFSCTLDTESGYERTIRIVATGATTLSTTITALNLLTPTAPDNTPLVNAALEGGAVGGDLLLTVQAKQYMSGNYDGEGHTITPANLAAFFVGSPGSALAEGDTLCIEYTMVSDTGSTGGRRQAIPENSNTAVPVGSFFNSRVNPEKLVNSLPIAKVINGSLVFGTGVEIPEGASSVPLGTSDLGSRIIRNPGFEHAVTLSSTRFGISDWENRSDLAVNGAFRVNTTIPFTGAKQLEFNQTAVGAATGRIEQQQEIAVNPGQSIRVSIAIRQLIAPTAGQYSVILYWGDGNSVPSGSTTVALQAIASTDAAYRQVASTIAVPGGKRFLKTVTIEVTGVTLGATGVSVLFDDLQVVCETQTGMTPAVDNTHLKPQVVDAVIVEDPSTYALGELAALLRMDKAVPALEGRLIGERKDQDYSGANLPPTLAWFGRLFQLGSALLGTEANALKPRITADYSAVAGVDYTLMWESARQGEVSGGYTEPAVRIYASNDGQMVMTSNAVWGGVTWTKDVAGQNATKQGIARDGVRIYTRVSDVAWSDASWDDAMRFTNPLGTAADARVPRITAGMFNGTLDQFTQLAAFNFTAYSVRIYLSIDTNNSALLITFNAQWNGTNWVKDTAGDVSTRIYIAQSLGTSVFPGALETRFQTCLTTDTFPEGDWTVANTTTTDPNSFGQLVVGAIYSGPSAGTSINPQARLEVEPSGFSGPLAAYYVDHLACIGTPNFKVDAFGNLDSNSGMIFEEFWHSTVPPGWGALTTGAGVVEANYEGVSRLRLNPGADAAGIRTNATVVQAAYSSFNAELRFPNILGNTSFGYTDVAANMYMGFIQNSAVYGDENFRVALRTGAGLQVFDTGITLTPIVDDWIKFRAFARGGSGLLTTTSVFWKIQSKKGTASGVFTPGGSILNPTSGVYFRFDAQTNAFMVIERMAMGGHNNFGL
jgi:hypothetical protein